MSRKKLIALIALGTVAIFLVAALVVGALGGIRVGNAVAVVRLSGTVQETGGGSLLGGGAITPATLRQRLREAEKDPRIKAVVLRMETGGGAVAASQEMAAMVRDFPKPVVVSMGDLVASGGYYIASQADWIVAQPGSLTGSIGVIWTNFNIQGLLDKLGVKLDAITAGKYKDMSLPRDLTPEERQIVQTMVDNLYEQFITAVAQGRELPPETVRALATGQLYTGEQALALKLVDSLGGLDDAIHEAERQAGIEDAQVIELAPSFWETIFSGPALADLKSLLASYLLGDDLALLHQFLNGYNTPRYGR